MSNKVNRHFEEDTGREMVYGYADEVSIKTNEQLDAIRERRRIKEILARGPIRNYVNCYHEPIAELNEILNVNELGTIMKVIPYMRMNTGGQLYYGKERMGIAELAQAIGKKQRQATTLAKALVENDVLIREKVGKKFVYNVNERYHSMGSVIKGAMYTRVFQVKTRTDIVNLSIQAAGVLYKMLPFFNSKFYYLCENPGEKEETAILHMSNRRFAELVNVDRKTVNNAIRELKLNGFIMSIDSFGAEALLINPDVMFRKATEELYSEYTEYVRSMFRRAAQNAEQQGVHMDVGDLPF